MRIFTIGDVVEFIVTQRRGASRGALLDIPGMNAARLASLQVLLGDMLAIEQLAADKRQDMLVVTADEQEIKRKLESKLGKWIRQL